MVIYLKHERHGTKVACSEIEAAYDETHGWVRFTLDPVVVPRSTPTVPQWIASDRERYVAKFGKPPHHKKSEATIKRELDA